MFGFHRKPRQKRTWKDRVKRPVINYVNPLRDGWSIIADAWREIAGALRQRPARDLEIEDALDRDFRLLLAQWGIFNHQLPTVIRGLRISATGWTILCAGMMFWFGVSAFHGRWFSLGEASIGALCAAGVASTRYWRLSVLHKKHFVPYTDWLIDAFGFTRDSREY